MRAMGSYASILGKVCLSLVEDEASELHIKMLDSSAARLCISYNHQVLSSSAFLTLNRSLLFQSHKRRIHGTSDVAYRVPSVLWIK
jgi:hypothetical protein